MESDWLTLAALIPFILLTFFQFSRIFFYSAFPRAVSHALPAFLSPFLAQSCPTWQGSHWSKVPRIYSGFQEPKRTYSLSLTASDFSKISVPALGHGGVGIQFCSSLVHPFWRGHDHESLQLLLSCSQGEEINVFFPKNMPNNVSPFEVFETGTFIQKIYF